MVEWILSKNPIRRLSRRGQSDEIKSEEIFRSLHACGGRAGKRYFSTPFRYLHSRRSAPLSGSLSAAGSLLSPQLLFNHAYVPSFYP